jgi:L-lactate dehydrogenase complex protein LldF
MSRRLADRDAVPTTFERAAVEALRDPVTRANVAHATTAIRARRARVIAEVPDWEELRDAGEAVRRQSLASMADLLSELETSVAGAGGVVHWARDATEANAIVVGLVEATGES